MNKFLEAAISYAENGIPVFPLTPKSKTPLTKHGVKDATTDITQIKTWWIQWPLANVGIPMGSVSGLIAVDIDYKDGCDPKFLEKLPKTVTVKSPNGGHHAYFKYKNGPIKNNLKLEKGATIRSDGYYFVVPPSELLDGRVYSFENGDLCKVTEDPPEWFSDIGASEIENKKPFEMPEKILDGEGREDNLFKLASSLRAKGLDYNEILAGLEAANKRCVPPKPAEDLERIARSVCKYEKGRKKDARNNAFDCRTNEVDKTEIGQSLRDSHVPPDDGVDSDSGEEKKESAEEKREKEAKRQKRIEQLGKEILDCRFKLFSNGKTTILYNITNIDKKEVEVCLNEEYLLRRLKTNIEKETGRAPKEKYIKEVYNYWRLSTKTLEQEPKSFTWIDEDEWSFKKLDFKPVPGAFPSWLEFLNRMSAPEDFMAFIWSIFETKSKSRQYLYLYDPNGQGGKSTVINVLGEVFGNAYTAINNSFVSGPAARWLLGNLYGKRLVCWPDVKNTKFCMTETLRNVTSGDDVMIEFKGERPFSTRMYLKLIMASNHEPSISSGGADVSRLIRINLSENKINKNDPEWKDKIRQELPYFLNECKKWYEEKCKNNGNMELQKETVESIEESTHGVEDKLEDIVSRRIEFSPEFLTGVSDWVQFCKEEKLDNHEIGNLKDYLSRQSPYVKFKRKITNGKKDSVYLGIKIKQKSDFEKELF